MGKVKAVALVAAAALCTDGRIADFTYWREDDTSTTVLRLVDEAPMAALAAD